MITARQYFGYNFKKILFIFCLLVLTAMYLFSCTPEPQSEIDDNFMEKYYKQAEEKFLQDSINKVHELYIR